jgi:hypothetical protein
MASWRVRARDFPPRLKKRCQVFLKSPLPSHSKKKQRFEKDDAIGRVQRELFARSLRLNVHTHQNIEVPRAEKSVCVYKRRIDQNWHQFPTHAG